MDACRQGRRTINHNRISIRWKRRPTFPPPALPKIGDSLDDGCRPSLPTITTVDQYRRSVPSISTVDQYRRSVPWITTVDHYRQWLPRRTCEDGSRRQKAATTRGNNGRGYRAGESQARLLSAQKSFVDYHRGAMIALFALPLFSLSHIASVPSDPGPRASSAGLISITPRAHTFVSDEQITLDFISPSLI
jgi:hypothetical protein